jgi:hypothetical protein
MRSRDLFDWAGERDTPPCSECSKLGPPINPNVHYCDGFKMWRGADERVPCNYRQPVQRERAAA